MNPWMVLGVSSDATDEQIRAAYLAKVKQYPPEAAPEQFEQVRDAYGLLRDPRARARLVMAGPDPALTLVELLDELPQTRAYAGPAAWIAVLEERK